MSFYCCWLDHFLTSTHAHTHYIYITIYANIWIYYFILLLCLLTLWWGGKKKKMLWRFNQSYLLNFLLFFFPPPHHCLHSFISPHKKFFFKSNFYCITHTHTHTNLNTSNFYTHTHTNTHKSEEHAPFCIIFFRSLYSTFRLQFHSKKKKILFLSSSSNFSLSHHINLNMMHSCSLVVRRRMYGSRRHFVTPATIKSAWINLMNDKGRIIMNVG